MNYRTAATLLFLAMAPVAQAANITVTDDTPARAIVITNDEDGPQQVVITAEVFTMAKCKEGLASNVEDMKDTAKVMLCVPADMSEAGRVVGDLPLIDLAE
ncbi:hypothetical protein HFO98_17070 [Rhizobium leguminosarum]|uniref:hypothetical protein n=1 Tax=Rhizobium leguminosarum TaxID=384 RepID=UPI001C937366|nr:hypothetical protein [Rhizobium leguminosarum]MBY5410150.1 hypothetical protein [Rhizobium leguminosarum]